MMFKETTDVSKLPKIRYPLLLFRFGAYEHIKALYEHGTVYCNTIQSFAKYDDNDLRGDPDEHAFKYTQYQPGTILELTPCDGKHVHIKLNSAVLKQHADSAWGNICCFHSIKLSQQPIGHEFTIHSRCKEFGTHCLFILDIEKFIDRLEAAMSLLELKGGRGFVTYHDMSKFNGERTIFQKDKRFSYQNEYRLFIENDQLKPIAFNIGSLQDIATMYPAEIADQFTCKLGNQ